MALDKQNLPKKKRNITIVDVAKESGVSYSTVSRVLNGFDYVKDDTRQRVMDAVDKLGYVANLQARGLAGGKTNIIGLLVPGLDNGYIGEVVRGIDEALYRANYNMMLYTTHRYQGKEAEYVKSISSGMTDGLLLIVPLTETEYLTQLQGIKFPYVLIDQTDKSGRSSIVDSTNWQGAYDATTYLINMGHRQIAYITGLMALNSAIERFEGYKAALADHHIPLRDDYVLHGDFYHQSGYESAGVFLQNPERPTAILCGNDTMAIGAMESIRNHGLSIPDDISIIGFDDIPQTLMTYPRLTTVRQSLDQMGRVAVQLLLEQMRDPEHPIRHITLATELIERESCRQVDQF
jgi:LacI family transcriptional regulator